MTSPSLPEKVTGLDAALAGARIPHAFGGALALAFYAEPRATIDIDVNVFVPPARHGNVAAALEPIGVAPGGDSEALERDGQGRWWWDDTPVDLFFAYDPLHDAMREGTRRVPFGEETIPILGPEHLAICKAAYDRPKDWLDIEQMLLVVFDIDRAEIRRWAERIVGPGDQRYERLDELLRRDER